VFGIRAASTKVRMNETPCEAIRAYGGLRSGSVYVNRKQILAHVALSVSQMGTGPMN
jgi:hypothetical protein